MGEVNNIRVVYETIYKGAGAEKAMEDFDAFVDSIAKGIVAINKLSANLDAYVEKSKAAAKASRDIHQAMFAGTDATLKSSEALRKETEAMLRRSKAGDEVVRKNLEWKKGQEQVAASTRVVTGSIAQMKNNLMTLQAALNATQNSKRQLTAADQGRIAAIRQLIFQQQQLIRTQQDLEKSQRPGFIARIVRSFVAWRLVINTLSVAFSKLKQEMAEGFEEVYGGTESFEELKDSIHRARNALVLMIGDMAGFEGGIPAITDQVNNLADSFLRVAAVYDAWKQTIGNPQELLQVAENFRQAQVNTGVTSEELQLTGLGGIAGAAANYKRLNELGREWGRLELERIRNQGEESQFVEDYIAKLEELNSRLDESVKKEEELADATGRILQLSRQWDKELERHDEQLAKIRSTLKEDIVEAAQDYRDEIADIEKDLADTLADIAEDAQKDMLDALKKGNAKLAKQNDDDLKDIERMQAEHNLRMKHMQEQFDLSRIQGERYYQFERGMLVAEGDVLAIEELDARHKLEQQAEEENFELRKRQQEELFRLQLQYQQQAARAQAAELRKALQDQLKEIAENARDKADQAMEDAEEARGEARDQLKQDLMDAQDAADKKLEIENDRHEQARKDQAQARADLAADLGIEVDPVVAAMEAIYGPDGKLSQMTDAYYVDRLRKEAAFRAALASMQVGTVTGGRTSLLSSDVPPAERRQYGGEFIATRPTGLVVGEGHRPERVVVQPLSAVSGNVTMRWGGGAIPIHGMGLGGADTSGLSAALANSFVPGLMTKLSASLRSRRGRRGY